MKLVYEDLLDHFSEEIGHPALLTREEERVYGQAIRTARKDITYALLENSPKTIDVYCKKLSKNSGKRVELDQEYHQFLEEIGRSSLENINSEEYEKVSDFLSRQDNLYYFPKIINYYKNQLEAIIDNSETAEKEQAEASKKEIEILEKRWRRAINRLVEPNLPLVISIAKKYRRESIQFNDIISEGYTGLMKAAEYFDSERRFKFSVSATWWITSAIQRLTKKERRHLLPSLDDKLDDDEYQDYYNTHPDRKTLEPISQIHDLRILQNIARVVARICDNRKNPIRDVGIVYLNMGIIKPEQDKEGNSIHPSIRIDREHKIVPPNISQRKLEYTNSYSTDDIARIYEMTRQNAERIIDLVAKKIIKQVLPTEIDQIGNLDLRKYTKKK